uniref:Secreted protein n=1 Tax=Syphacia muris TaxID=451379 RepID=A0A0N5AJS7_9BILA
MMDDGLLAAVLWMEVLKFRVQGLISCRNKRAVACAIVDTETRCVSSSFLRLLTLFFARKCSIISTNKPQLFK